MILLTVEDVEESHRIQLARFGGASGLRDRGLLESADWLKRTLGR